MTNDKVVYTAVFNGYDILRKPTVITPGWDYICFTDCSTPSPPPDSPWRLVRLMYSPLSPVLASKMVKILWYQYVWMYDLSIWIDGSLTVNCNLDDFIEKYHRGKFTVMKHPARECIYDEGEVIKKLNIAKRAIVDKQLNRYREEGFPPKQGLTANGVMVRSEDLLRDTFNVWWGEVRVHCHRDQLSFMYANWKEPIPMNLIPYEIITDEFQFHKHGR